jgi:hypothetical protein
MLVKIIVNNILKIHQLIILKMVLKMMLNNHLKINQ